MGSRYVPLTYSFYNEFGNLVNYQAYLNFDPNGLVTIETNGLPLPQNIPVDLHGTYSLSTSLSYSNQVSGPFTRQCNDPNQQGSVVNYTVQPYMFYASNQQDADAQAWSYLYAHGQDNANQQGSCLPLCDFQFSPGDIQSYTSGRVASNGAQLVFSFNFNAPYDYYTGGTIGYITGGCTLPFNSGPMNVQDPNDYTRVWQVTFNGQGGSFGTVQISLVQGNWPFANQPVTISGSWPQ
ncbi:MAG: hypothetical protein JST42_12175 [Bacteroidetes bacterium]|nr:hypothetical protein [Bacteroidota bacterium]